MLLTNQLIEYAAELDFKENGLEIKGYWGFRRGAEWVRNLMTEFIKDVNDKDQAKNITDLESIDKMFGQFLNAKGICLKKKDIIEGTEKIFFFMGFKPMARDHVRWYDPNGYFDTIFLDDVVYFEQWDKLMPVFARVAEKGYRYRITRSEITIDDEDNNELVNVTGNGHDTETAFKALIEFIEGYNTNIKNKDDEKYY